MVLLPGRGQFSPFELVLKMFGMTNSRYGGHRILMVVVSLRCLSAVITDQSAASESLEGPPTAFDSKESPTMDYGSNEDTGNDLMSPEVILDRQSRRSSFRADLGKRYPVDWTPIKGKRAAKMSFFRSDLGKRRWYVEPTTGWNKGFKDDDEKVVETTYGVEPTSGSFRSKRFVVGELGGQIERGGPDRWNDVEKRARSSFRADLGKRSENEHEYGMFEYGTNDEDVETQLKESAEYPKRARYAFRGDLGKRSQLGEDEKRRYAFRGDLGRKRSQTLGTWNTRTPMPSSTFDAGAPFQNWISSMKGRAGDRDYDSGLEKKKFRADLG